jgi:hypothetical protein
MTRGRVALVLALVLAAGARPVGAQPAGPPPDAGLPTGGGRDAFVWNLSLGVQEAYESNVLYGYLAGPGQTTGDYLTRFNATLGRSFPAKRGRLALGFQGGAAVYQQVADLNQFTWGVRAAGGYDFTRRFSADVAASSALGYIRDFIRTDPSSGLAPYTPTRFDNGSATIRVLAAQKTTIRFDARGERYVFQSTRALTNGKGFVASAAVEQALSAGSRLSGVGEFERTSYGPTFEVERVLTRWSRSLGPYWAAQFEAGIARYHAVAIDPTIVLPGWTDPTQPRFGPALQVKLSGHQRRHSLTVSGGRNVGQTYGFGTVGTITYVNVAYGYGPFHGVTLVANAEGSRASETPVGVPPDGFNVGAGVHWQVVRHLGLVLDASQWGRTGGTALTPEAPWNGWTVSLSATYGVALH